MDRQANLSPNCEVIYDLAHDLNYIRTDIIRVTERGFASLEREQFLRKQLAEAQQDAQDPRATDVFTRAVRDYSIYGLKIGADTHAQLRPLVIRGLDVLHDREKSAWKSVDEHIAEHTRYGMCSPTWQDMLRVHNLERLEKVAGFLGRLLRLPSSKSNT